MDKRLSVGGAAEASGMSPRMIRHYEGVGLLPRSERTASGYRTYGPRDVEALRLIRQAREVGFGTPEIKALLVLWKNPDRASSKVKQLARQQVAALDVRQKEIEAMRQTLAALIERCPGDDRPGCAILDGLARAPVGERGTKR